MESWLQQLAAGRRSLAELFAELSNRGAVASSLLSHLWKQSAHAKLLQRPPADHISAKQEALFQQTCDNAVELGLCSDVVLRLQQSNAGNDEHAEQFLQATLAARPISTLAGLMVWLQRQPELLRLHEQAVQQPFWDDQMSYCNLWIACSSGLCTLLLLLSYHSRNAKLLVQAAEELVGAELPQGQMATLWASGDADNDALITRRSLFLSQLARKHPVPFFQFLDVCASNGWR
ncbi:hypothetical protein OEZ86_002816 [Tetradesmus obliquus]|nr:hypothetical protein OEZ86_002816 [Tetradesmus obliquus]